MVKRLLIDATHEEEVRVAVVNGSQLEEFDSETSHKKQIKSNIYLAKVIRVEPSLQAVFVEYSGGRHGFLPFAEIHPDYYRIPVADRKKLEEENAKAALEEEMAEIAEMERRASLKADLESAATGKDALKVQNESALQGSNTDDLFEGQAFANSVSQEALMSSVEGAEAAGATEESGAKPGRQKRARRRSIVRTSKARRQDAPEDEEVLVAPYEVLLTGTSVDGLDDALVELSAEQSANLDVMDTENLDNNAADYDALPDDNNEPSEDDASVGSIPREERSANRRRLQNRYKIQEVIKRRQILLVQVVKDERGNKGAALTTYLSLPGRYCVLMPNAGHRAGGVSRKISDGEDRKRLRELMKEFEVPEGMSLIVRTAGQERNRAEIRRDYEYLLRLWDEIRDKTLQSIAPTMVYAEGDLVKRAIRDIYDRDIEEVLVEGEEAYKAAKGFMKGLIPSHAKKVKLYKDTVQPIFFRYNVEPQILKMHEPVQMLPSGGSIVINHTEALVAIDVNSGRSTRERHIDETAFKTNMEAAAEVVRQLRLRDIGGLVVVDFIDMRDQSHIAQVERKVRELLKHDRARVQVGRISQFGLLELSRQRLRPSLLESHSMPCAHCKGTGLVRSHESLALQILREAERLAITGRVQELMVMAPSGVDLYLLNQKRSNLVHIENRFDLSIVVTGDDNLDAGQVFKVIVTQEREKPLVIAHQQRQTDADVEEVDEFDEEILQVSSQENTEEDEDQDNKKRNRRSSRRRRQNRKSRDNKVEGDEQSLEPQEFRNEDFDFVQADSSVDTNDITSNNSDVETLQDSKDRRNNRNRRRHPFQRRSRHLNNAEAGGEFVDEQKENQSRVKEVDLSGKDSSSQDSADQETNQRNDKRRRRPQRKGPKRDGDAQAQESGQEGVTQKNERSPSEKTTVAASSGSLGQVILPNKVNERVVDGKPDAVDKTVDGETGPKQKGKKPKKWLSFLLD